MKTLKSESMLAPSFEPETPVGHRPVKRRAEDLASSPRNGAKARLRPGYEESGVPFLLHSMQRLYSGMPGLLPSRKELSVSDNSSLLTGHPHSS